MRELLAEAMLVKGWSGLLPDPESFLQYPESVQERMMSWNDAKIIDESKRLDKLVDADIRQSSVDSLMSFLINIVFALISFLAFVITGNPASFGFLAVPGVSIAINGVDILRRGERRRGNPDQEQAQD